MNKKLQQFSFVTILLLVGVSFVGAVQAQAASFSISDEITKVDSVQQVSVTIHFNEEHMPVNAIEGDIAFSSESLRLIGVYDGNSIINFWIERPDISIANTESIAHFAGIIPGGYRGEGKILTAVFEAVQDGSGEVQVLNGKAFLNNASGNSVPIPDVRETIFISSATANSDSISESTFDVERPETFVPLVATGPSMFGGKWFIAFSTQDKNSGVSRYEVLESKLMTYRLAGASRWKQVTSPQVVSNQQLSDFIYVRAVDYAGNVRVVRVSPINPLPWFRNPNVGLLLAVCGVGALPFLWVVRRVKKRFYAYWQK